MQKLILGIAAIIVVLVAVGFSLPQQSRFVASTSIDAHPATVFALVNDLRQAALWSPMNDSDPNVRRQYSGAQRGVGATTSWDSQNAGSGTQTIVDSQPYRYVETLINAGEPSATRTWIEIDGGDGISAVRWGFEHDYGLNIVGRYFGLMVTGVIRSDYENGLRKLKELAESLPAADFSELQVEHVQIDPVTIAYVATGSSPDAAAVSEALGDAYFEILTFFERHSLETGGSPISIARPFSGGERRFDAGIPVRGIEEATPRTDGRVRVGKTYGGPAIRALHVGGYDRLYDTHRKIAAYLAALGLEKTGDAWESYINDPAEVSEDELETLIYYPVAGQ